MKQIAGARLFSRWLLAMLLALAGAAQAQRSLTPVDRPTQWTITATGALGDIGGWPNAINNRGEVVGYSGARTPGSYMQPNHPFLWANGVLQDLGVPGGGTSANAVAVNDKGLVLAVASQRPYLWKDGQWIALGFEGSAADMNESGAVAGDYSVGSGTRPYYWKNGVLIDLGTLGGDFSLTSAMNDHGRIVGQSFLAGNTQLRGFVVDPGGAMRDLGTLGGDRTVPNDINNRGVIVGTSKTATGSYRAFIDDGTGIRQLLDAPGASAVAINDRGAIVGQLDRGSFLYEDGKVTVLESIPEVRAQGWKLLVPLDINERGWITGVGLRPGSNFYTGFVLVPSNKTCKFSNSMRPDERCDQGTGAR